MTSMRRVHAREGLSEPASSTVRRWLGRLRLSSTVLALGLTLLFVMSSATATPIAHPTYVAAPPAPAHVVPINVGSSISSGAAGTLRPDTSSLQAGGRTLHAPAFAAPVKAAPPSSGRGTFFQSSLMPSPTNGSCITKTQCFNNNTNEPSLNLTTKGLLAVAYTAYTNASPCVAMQGNATTEVGFSASTNLGTTWSTPIYLGNPVCTGVSQNFSSAAQPSLSSLSNGTLVLSYEEMNFTHYCYTYGCYGYAAPEFYCYELYWDRIVETQSYDNGTTWTTPVVLDTVNNSNNGSSCTYGGLANYPDLQPWVTAYGQTIYVAWTNISQYYFCKFSEGISLRASTDGGSTWSSTYQVPAVAGSYSYCSPSTSYAATNPSLTVTSNGTLLIAYLTGIGLVPVANLSYSQQGAQVELAWSTNNGSTFSDSKIAGNIVTYSGSNFCCTPSVFESAMPSISYSAATGQIFVAWSSMRYMQGCDYEGSGTYCSSQLQVSPITVANSSTGGSTWTTHLIMEPLIVPGGAENYLLRPSIASTTNGVLHLQATYLNDSVCYPNAAIYLGTSCGVLQQVYMNSSDNGTTWSLPVYVYYNYSGCGYPYFECTWPGQYSTMVPAGNTVFLAWTWESCVTGTGYGYCYWYYNVGDATVVVSQLYTGAGIGLTFTETGLPTTVSTWSVNVMGNVRVGAPGTSLVVSGVPAAQIVSYASPWVYQGWGVVYESAYTPASPSSFAAATTIPVTFTEYVKFNIQTIPVEQSYFFNPSGTNYYSDISMSPLPGGSWILPGTAQSVTITQIPLYNYCYGCLNLSFISWTGSGPGNVTTLSQNISVTPTGPVNETANFNINGWCWHIYNYYNATYVWFCLNNSFFPLTFSQAGLPANVSWSVTLLFQNGTSVTNSSQGTTMGFFVPSSPTYFYVWTVPQTGGKFWVPSTDVGSPVAPLANSHIEVTFTLQTAASALFATRFVESGLPAGTPWTVVYNGLSFGVQANNTTLSVAGGGPYAVNASFVYLETGYGFYAGSVTVTSYVVNQTAAVTTKAGGTVYLNGSGVVLITFRPMYLLTMAASVGGTVTPASQWVVGGNSVTLGETPSAGYHFVGWTGVGTGATTTAQDSTTAPTIAPGSPVTEFATFRPNAPPTWNVTVNAVGLPLGATFDFAIGGSSYSASGTVKIGEIVNGNYSVNVPYVYLNSSETTRFVPTGIESSLSFTSGGLLEITANGSLNVTYTTQYLLQFSVTPTIGGAIAPTPGATWYNAGVLVTLTATPAHGYYFVSWNSTSGTLATKLKSTSLTVTGPDAITAQFMKRPIAPPATYWLNVTQSGLPAGVVWNVSLGAYGASGVNGTLQVVGLNGSYTLAVPIVFTTTAGVRYTSASNGTPETVTSNATLQVTFVKQYLLTISATAGGTITPSASEWVAAGTTVTITATPNATSKFSNWTGSGADAYLGTDSAKTITMNGPVTEAATFSPVYIQKVTTQSAATTGNLSIAFGLLAALLVVGLVAGLIMGRRRQRGPPAVQEWEQGEEPAAPVGGAIYDESGEPAPEGPG